MSKKSKLLSMFDKEKPPTLTEKPLRAVAEIQAEYQALCTRAGHLQYQIYAFSADLETINDTLKELNLEAAKSNAAEKAKAAEAAEAPAPQPVQ